MEFWGVEIKSGESLVVENEGDKMLHLSQACLSEVKKNKGAEPVYLFAKVGDQKFVLGILSSDKTPRVTFDLVFKKKFELSHTWKNGSVHFLGYKGSEDQHDGGPDSDSDTDSDYSEDDIVPIPNAGTSTLQAKKEVKGANLNNDIKSDVKGSADNDEDDESSEESSDDEQAKVKKEEEEISDDELESDDEESDDSEEDEKVVEKKVDTSKKRPAKAATKTSTKKAKLVTPEKSGGKTGGNNVAHVATPYPTRQAAKIAAKSDQPTQQTPNTARAFACKSCDKSFGSDVALQSHTKAKHANGN